MNAKPRLIQLGAPDPELKNSPILEESDEEFGLPTGAPDEAAYCYFNNIAYPNGQKACSGSGELICCVDGVWVRQGSCDPDHP